MIQRRVNITGIGPVTPAGTGHEAFLRGIFQNKPRAVATRIGEGREARAVAAALVPDFRLGAHAVDAVYLNSTRHVQFALAATMLALRDAGLALAEVRARKPLVVLASPAAERGRIMPVANGSPNSGRTQEVVARWVRAGTMPTAPAYFASGLATVGHAAAQVASGAADLAICGGVDVPFQPVILEEMRSLGLSAGHADEPQLHCRPFDLWRGAGLAGEGGCMFVLEPESSSRPRIARVAGVGVAIDKSSASWSGFGEAARLALGNARLRPVDVDCLYADGVGQKALDRAETQGLKGVFGSHLAAMPVAAIQGAVGNALGGAGAIQLGCAALGMKHSLIAPTVNWRHPDPSCPLNLSPTVRQLGSRATLLSTRDPNGAVSCLLLTP
ncbi:MAG: beta-ketoacyl synthase N-terminal-like domain-containing protein [Nibricoccus sp.]